ncbi:alpha/beta hydrolase, partial [Nonomuraea roseoviolacea]|uniref:alpha/beta hydrolase n=1 Tax=Nonomuraea roseoviolacea TaxID=103837 RepID=UPI0031CEDDEE
TALAVGIVAALWRGRGRTWPGRLWPFVPVVAATALTASVCVPTVPTTRQYPPDLPFVATEHWSLSTGSRVAVYHYPAATPRRPTPLVYLHGGPVRSISVLDHRFLRLLAGQGYDVYAYEHPGGGRSDLLPMEQYTISRSVRDLAAFIDRLGKGRADVLGFSAGAIVLTRALATPATAARVHRAIIAEPGPMDGPTALITGRQGRPSARGLALAPAGARATRVPRYAVALGLIQLGLLPPDTGLITQAEGVNAFKAADLGSDTASAYCARDAGRIPTEDTAENFSFNAAASLRIQQTIRDSPSIAPELSRSRTPAMLMIAECSSQTRQWQTAILAADPAIERTQYMPGVGHRLWNGLDDNSERAAAVITAFLQNEPSPLP